MPPPAPPDPSAVLALRLVLLGVGHALIFIAAGQVARIVLALAGS